MRWYDVFATVYDASVERVYRPYRREAVDALSLRPHATVLDLACGTGPTHEHLVAAGAGSVVAVDLSAGMLERARRRAADRGWTAVRCLQADAREVDRAAVAAAVGGGDGALDAAICCLGLSVIPDWQTVLATTWDLLRPGGRLVVFDVYTRRWVPTTAVVRLLARADTTRTPWVEAEALGARVEHRWLPGSPHVHGGTPYLAIATKA